MQKSSHAPRKSIATALRQGAQALRRFKPGAEQPGGKPLDGSTAEADPISPTDYDQDVQNVTSTITLIMAASLPSPNKTPANWVEIQQAYAQARSDAQLWTNQVYPELNAAPTGVESYNQSISQLLADATSQASALIANPGDADAQMALATDLQNIELELSYACSFVGNVQAAINNFGANTLTDAATQFNTITVDAYADEAIDQAKIDDIKAEIAHLQSEIQGLGVALKLTGAEIDASLDVLTVSVASGCLPVALGAVIFLAIGVSAVTLEIDQLEDDEKKLAKDSAALTSDEQDCAAFQTVGDTFQNLASQTTALSASVDGIATAWATLAAEVNAALVDVAAAIADGTDYQAIYDDLVDASACWEAAYADAALLSLPLNGNGAVLQIGDSEAAINAAIAANPTLDFVTFINHYNQ